MADLASHENEVDHDDLDDELQGMRARVADLEREAAEKEAEQEAMEALLSGATPAQSADGTGKGTENGLTSGSVSHEDMVGSVEVEVEDEDPALVDSRSVYVGNVDYAATPEELQQHFASCGSINRITILCDKFTGNPKGYAYVEFAEPSYADTALALNESLFRGRLIKVTSKRTNIHGFNQRGRGRGRGRGGYRGGYQPGGNFYNPYSRPPRARGRGRGRGF